MADNTASGVASSWGAQAPPLLVSEIKAAESIQIDGGTAIGSYTEETRTFTVAGMGTSGQTVEVTFVKSNRQVTAYFAVSAIAGVTSDGILSFFIPGAYRPEGRVADSFAYNLGAFSHELGEIQVGTNGEALISATGGANMAATLTSVGATTVAWRVPA